MTNNIIVLWELQKITRQLTKTKDEHTLNFRMIKQNERFNFNYLVVNTSKLGLFKLSAHNLLFNIKEINSLCMLLRLLP